jgi:outer membrane protein W
VTLTSHILIRDKTHVHLSVTFFIAKNKSVESGAWRYYRHIIRVGVNKALNTKDAILVPPYLKIYEAKLFNKNAAAASLSSPFFLCS